MSTSVTKPAHTREKKELEKQLKQIQIENDGLKVEIKKRETEIKFRIEKHKETDSLLNTLKLSFSEKEKRNRQEIADLKRKLPTLSVKEKEKLITEYYEKAN